MCSWRRAVCRVEFFFALSGFILVHVYVARPRFRYFEFLEAPLARLLSTTAGDPAHHAGDGVAFSLACGAWTLQPRSTTSPAIIRTRVSGASWGNLFLVQAWHLFPRL